MMDIKGAHKVIENLQTRPFICSENTIELDNGYVIAKKKYFKEIEKQPQIGDWIPCNERLPEEKINPITNDFYEYQVTFQCGDVSDVRHYKFGNGHWWYGGGCMDEYVVAWKSRTEPYKA